MAEWTPQDYDKYISDRTQKLESDVTSSQAKHEEKESHFWELRTSFCEKLATLNAGSLAVVASMGAALLSKPIANRHEYIALLGSIAIMLWFSLVFSVVHNLWMVNLASVAIDIARGEHLLALIQRSLWAKRDKQEQLDPFIEGVTMTAREQGDRQARRRKLQRRANLYLGIAVLMFVAAYTLVLVGIMRMWRLA
jgi:hypothetical protein